VFNDILTGKASIEPPREPISPYRENNVPPVRHACVSCHETYAAPAGSPRDRCPTCQLAMVELNRQQSDQTFLAAQAQRERAARSHRILYAAIMIAAGIAVVLFRGAMRTQMREDAAQAAGYHSYGDYKSERDSVYPTDEYSSRIHDMADEMCRCSDLACARNVQARFLRFAQSDIPSDDKARTSVDQDTVRLGECEATYERN
jgi:hypothetical protein